MGITKARLMAMWRLSKAIVAPIARIALYVAIYSTLIGIVIAFWPFLIFVVPVMAHHKHMGHGRSHLRNYVEYRLIDHAFRSKGGRR